MALTPFTVYSVSLVLYLVAFASVGFWGQSQPDFEGWKVAKANGPFWQAAMFLFMYSGILSDVAFIRTAVVLANLFITAWVTFGVAEWPHIWFTPLAEIHWDQFVWCFICVFVNGLPMFRQFRFDDAEKKFRVGKKYEEMAESMWREWWHRSGIPRTDFKLLVESCEWMELSPGTALEMNSQDTSDSDTGSESMVLEENTMQENYYYVVQGTVQCSPSPGSGRKDFTVTSGHFCDAFNLMAALGQTSACIAMQTGPLTATVVENRNAGETTTGAIVLRWKQSTIADKIMRSHGFAPACLKTIVSSATLEAFYRYAVTEDNVDRYQMIEQKRREMVRGPLPKDAAMPKRSLWRQFVMSHVTWHDLWDPSPHQRVVNAMSLGSRELAFLKEVQESRGTL